MKKIIVCSLSLLVGVSLPAVAMEKTSTEKQKLQEDLRKNVAVNNIKKVEALLDAGADVDFINALIEVTPLMTAAYNEDTDMVELLLYKGADVNVKNNNGTTALYFATCSCNNTDLIRLFLECGVDDNQYYYETLLMAMVYYGNIELVKLCIARGANVGAQDSNGNTALTKAKNRPSGRDTSEIIRLLETYEESTNNNSN